jgi:hypothetical protein
MVDGGASALDILGGVEARRGVDEIDHVIPHAAALLIARFVGRDVEALVNLARVGDDDLAPELERHLEGQRGLADACRPDDYRNSRSQ